jgi:hypothetical protein
MAAANTLIRDKLLEMCDTGVNIDKKDERSIWRIIFATRILRVELQHAQYWVIDGLDECANHASLFPLLARIDNQVRLRVFMTSRPSLVIERSFSRENMARIAESITLDASLGDTRLFLQQHASHFLAESKEERDELVQTILDMSNGNFLWTNLVVKKIEDAVSKEQVHTILNSVPKEMEDLYRQISRNVMTESPSNAIIARAILRWTLCSLRPLFVEELKEALRLDIGESLSQLEKTAGPICGNLIYVDAESRVQAAHQTARDFFFRQHDGFEFGMIKEKEHARIVEVCLEYLCGEEMKPARFRRASSSAHKAVKRSPFAAYAIVYFSDHISHASSSNGAHLTALNIFLTNNSLTWIEAVARTQDLTPLIQTAKNIKAYLERRAKHNSPLGVEFQNISTWANDLTYLVAQFGKTLVTSPHAMTHLIPPVCPQKSIIFRSFKSHRRGLEVVGLW